MKVKNLFDKDFTLLMLAKVISLIGTQMQEFALSLYVLKITGSATKYASVIVVALLPQLILGPFIGVFADWFDRKKLIVILDIVNGIVVLSFALMLFTSQKLSLPYIYALVLILSVVSTLYQPALGTVIPSIVKSEKLVDANGVNSFIMNVGNLIAPALAGVLFGTFGLFTILLSNGISFLLGAIFEMFIAIPKTNKMPEKVNFKAFKDDFMQGIKFIGNTKIILTVVLLAAVINFAFSPLSIGLTYVLKQILKVSDMQYGLMQSIFVVSMMIAPFINSFVSKKVKTSSLIFYSIFFSSVVLGICAVVPSPFYLKLFKGNIIPYITLTVLSFIMGIIITIANITLNVMFQKIVPLQMMGRVGTVMSTGCMACAPLGQIIFGLLFDSISSWICILIAASIACISVLFFKKPLNDNATEPASAEA